MIYLNMPIWSVMSDLNYREGLTKSFKLQNNLRASSGIQSGFSNVTSGDDEILLIVSSVNNGTSVTATTNRQRRQSLQSLRIVARPRHFVDQRVITKK